MAGLTITGYKYALSTSADNITYSSYGSYITSSWTSGTTFTITGLTNGTYYKVKIRAVNALGDGAESAEIGAFVPNTVPSTPSAATLTAGNATDTFTWTAPASNGSTITKYAYQVSTDSGSSWYSAIGGTLNGETETANLSVVLATQYILSSYKLRVRAFNNGTNGGWSSHSTISSSGTAVWINNTGTDTDTDTACGPAGCSDTENVTETDTETVTETDTDTACGPAGCSESQNCECGTQSRTRTSSRSRTRTRSRDRTRVRSRTRTRTSSRTRTRSTQFYSRSGSTSSGVTYSSYGAYTGYTYSAYGEYGGYSYTAYTAYGSYYYSVYGAYTAYTYGAFGAFGGCAGGTQNNVTVSLPGYSGSNPIQHYSSNRGPYPFYYAAGFSSWIWGNTNGTGSIGCGGGCCAAGPSVIYQCSVTGTITTNDGTSTPDACVSISF